jgi:hypothetical protein
VPVPGLEIALGGLHRFLKHRQILTNGNIAVPAPRFFARKSLATDRY